MFFSEDLLTRKKGSFGVIWLAATLGTRSKKINRKDLSAVDLAKTCELIAEPPQPMALRLSGCLLVGVARVYNQTYEIFYADVNQFHSILRKSLAAGITSDGMHGGTAVGIDLIGEGRSTFHQITFSDSDASLLTDVDLTYGFGHINWMDPLGKRKRRRSTSKLTSLDSLQASLDNDDEGAEDDSDEESEEESQLSIGRKKRSKIGSSPFILGSLGKNTKPGSSYQVSDLGIDQQDLNFGDTTIDLGLDLSGFNGETSSGEPFDAVEGPSGTLQPDFADVEQNPNPDKQASGESGLEGGLPEHRDDHPLSALNRESMGENLSEVEVALQAKPHKDRKTKKKRIQADESLELAEGQTSSAAYLVRMRQEAAMALERTAHKDMGNLVDNMIDGAGGWLRLLNSEIGDVLVSATRVDSFQWEKDLASHKRGTLLSGGQSPPPASPELRGLSRLLVQHDAIATNIEDMPTNYDDFEQGIDVDRQRPGSEIPIMRRGSQQNAPGPIFPWQDVAFGQHTDADGEFGGFDSAFTPGSLRLSIMTPQEVKIRQRSRQGSSASQGPPGVFRSRSGSFAGSLTGRAEHAGAGMLIGDDSDDLELPVDEPGLSFTQSQADRREGIPDAFKPEMLAGLNKQCRDFLSFIEKKLLIQNVNRIQLDDLMPSSSKRQVGASAFYNCLTLATKRCLDLEQAVSFGPISIGLAV